MGVALGYRDPQHPKNQYRSPGRPLHEVVHFKVQSKSKNKLAGSLSDANQSLFDQVNRYRNFFRASCIISFGGHSNTCPWYMYILQWPW